MEAVFSQVTHWHWWILMLLLVVLETVVPGTFFLWMGIAAAVVGLLLLLVPAMGWESQLLLFAVLSVASIGLWRALAARRPGAGAPSALNRRGEQYVGRHFTLAEPIVNGFGKIKVDDSTWRVEGRDCPAGTTVRVIGVDGVVLRVEPDGS